MWQETDRIIQLTSTVTKIHLFLTNAASFLTCYPLSSIQVVCLSVMLEKRQDCWDSGCWTAQDEQRRRVLRRWDRWVCGLCQKTLAFADIGISSPALTHQGWSQMIPVRSVLRMPWCRLTAAPRRRMECGSAGKGSCARVSIRAFFSPLDSLCTETTLQPHSTCIFRFGCPWWPFNAANAACFYKNSDSDFLCSILTNSF